MDLWNVAGQCSTLKRGGPRGTRNCPSSFVASASESISFAGGDDMYNSTFHCGSEERGAIVIECQARLKGSKDRDPGAEGESWPRSSAGEADWPVQRTQEKGGWLALGQKCGANGQRDRMGFGIPVVMMNMSGTGGSIYNALSPTSASESESPKSVSVPPPQDRTVSSLRESRNGFSHHRVSANEDARNILQDVSSWQELLEH